MTDARCGPLSDVTPIHEGEPEFRSDSPLCCGKVFWTNAARLIFSKPWQRENISLSVLSNHQIAHALELPRKIAIL